MTHAKENARILMCRPDFFEVSYAINPWMHPDEWTRDKDALTAQALREWQALHDRFTSLGIALELMPPAQGLPDMVFTANGAVVLDGKALVARFMHPERQGEEPHFVRHFETLKGRGLIDTVAVMEDGVYQEGAGDCIYDRARHFFWAGYGQRSKRAAADAVSSFFGRETVPLELTQPAYYHLDVCMCPLSRGHIVYFPAAFTDEALARLKHRAGPENLIEAREEDAAQLAVNAVNVGDDIVMAACGPELKNALEARGYTVHVVPLETFRRSGGAAFCLTLRLDLQSPEAS